MAPFIQSVLDQVKGDVAEALSPQKIEQICHELNYVWRACTLDPPARPTARPVRGSLSNSSSG